MNLSLIQAMFQHYANANQHQFLQGLAFYWNSKVKAEIFERSSSCWHLVYNLRWSLFASYLGVCQSTEDTRSKSPEVSVHWRTHGDSNSRADVQCDCHLKQQNTTIEWSSHDVTKIRFFLIEDFVKSCLYNIPSENKLNATYWLFGALTNWDVSFWCLDFFIQNSLI